MCAKVIIFFCFPIFFAYFCSQISKNDMSQKINVLIDCSHIKRCPDHPISLHIYAGRLMKGLNNSHTIHPIVLVHKGVEKYIDTLAGFCVDKILVNGCEKRLISQKLDRILGLIPLSVEKEMQERNIKAVITPDFSPFSFSFPKKYHQHLVVHDLIRIRRPKNKVFYYTLMLRRATMMVPHIITISEATRADLKAWSGRDSVAIHNSVPFDFRCTEESVRELSDKRFILDVNRIDWYKNQGTLIRAFYLIKDKIPHCLYFKGLSDNNDILDYKHLVSQLGLEDRVIWDLTSRSEGELRWLYTHADLFVTPSLIEGFGYTPIEAAVLKTPVLVSNINTLMEVTQGKLESFDPHDPEELAEKILNKITNPPTDEEKDAISTFFLEEYSLEKQIEQFTKVILTHIGKNEQ